MESALTAKILVIDDDPGIRLVIQKILQKQGYDVILASDGQQGIDLATQIQPALIICDWIMPVLDGLEVCRRVRANPALATTYFILLTSRGEVSDRVTGLNTGADDFLSKPVEISELQARVRAALRLHQLSQDLQTQKQLLEAELAEAATYVRSLLPPPLLGTVNIDARFIPCRQLGGDCFDYFWLDPDYLAIYLLDVSGHGLGSALPSSLVLNLLRSHVLPAVNFYQPHDVLHGLNEAFQMNLQNQKYFTIWYGVYNQAKRQLTYASAGHPPAILIAPTETGSPAVHRLATPSVPIGILPEVSYNSDRQTIPPNSTLYIFSDGIYEAGQLATPSKWNLDAFVELLVQLNASANLDSILEQVQQSSGVETFDDDLSLLKVNFS
ncbi:PP2C family protein-serine/threonine phosphatase [Thermocoleostomius sinensis]|jgi:sigma-B regulation protein RsbU (phosphoserine phosphatase)|uniref:SpoIIE family protein phosphatase n=1 Tax=Thermocoleostomius sinensis A174 TaxID=2016057 RepID=A0A9E8ZK92_9CYAN|nr:SpoIIE family protein phosphatase [Thermocoleostomius sinensis]WAL62753.1 SpoIIE family protein phosphatase [Thermocoleostomius sinensis A174]